MVYPRKHGTIYRRNFRCFYGGFLFGCGVVNFLDTHTSVEKGNLPRMEVIHHQHPHRTQPTKHKQTMHEFLFILCQYIEILYF
jgi:hypothetical protein